METHVWKLTGLSSLMQSNPLCMSEGEELTKGKKKYDDKQEAEMRCYMHEGAYVHPTRAFRNGLNEAAKGMKLKKVALRTVFSAAVFPTEEWMYLLDKNGKPIKKYTIDKRTVVIQSKRIFRCRPRFDEWTAQLPLDVEMDEIDLDIITQILNRMGRFIGIGEYRPDCSKNKTGVGTFGRFRAELVS